MGVNVGSALYAADLTSCSLEGVGGPMMEVLTDARETVYLLGLGHPLCRRCKLPAISVVFNHEQRGPRSLKQATVNFPCMLEHFMDLNCAAGACPAGLI